MLKRVESLILFVEDVVAAANWYAEILGAEAQFDNAQFAFVSGPGIVIGFHPVDDKCPGGVGGTSAYWEVENLESAVAFLTERGARVHRGPIRTESGAGIALLIDPFGCTVGVHVASEESRGRFCSLVPAIPDGMPPVEGE